jgi:hypothetical protein
MCYSYVPGRVIAPGLAGRERRVWPMDQTGVVVEASVTHEADLVLHLAVRKGADLDATEKACRREFEAFMWLVTELLTAPAG